MTAECGRPNDHDSHYDLVDGVLIKCDGDSSKRVNYDNSPVNRSGN